MEVEEKLPIMPENCPSCNKKSKNLLLHIRKKQSCSSKIDPKLYEYWKREQNKHSKRKFQSSYVEKGKHSVAQAKYIGAGKHKNVQAKYEQKFRKYCKVCKTPTRQDCKCPLADRQSFLQTKRHNQSKWQNRDNIRRGEDDGDRRLKRFRKLCSDCLWCLKRGNIRNDTNFHLFNSFHLVEAEVKFEYINDDTGEVILDYDDDETHSWLSEVDGRLLSLVIRFQNVVLIPKSKWISTIKEVNSIEDNEKLKENLYKLIGKLQSYENENTKEISIPEDFKIGKAMNDAIWKMPDTLTDEDEDLLVNLLLNIVDDEDVNEELIELLGLSQMDDNIETAMVYTKTMQITSNMISFYDNI